MGNAVYFVGSNRRRRRRTDAARPGVEVARLERFTSHESGGTFTHSLYLFVRCTRACFCVHMRGSNDVVKPYVRSDFLRWNKTVDDDDDNDDDDDGGDGSATMMTVKLCVRLCGVRVFAPRRPLFYAALCALHGCCICNARNTQWKHTTSEICINARARASVRDSLDYA